MAIDDRSRKFLKKFGLRIRALRDENGWTLEQAEEHGGPSWPHLADIETGKKNVSLITVKRLAKLYKISISELFKGL